jgi:NitT/TauT family transport system substrate-binding protein
MKQAATSLVVALALLVSASADAAERVHIAVPTWVGFGPLYVARDKGFFTKNGIEAVLTPSEDAKQHYPLLLAGKYDMVAGAAGTSVLFIKNSDDLQYVTILDDSNGGDGIVARKEINSLSDLKGKTIGVNVASISEFYLNVLLREAGLSENEVTVVEMSPTEAGRAFMAQRVEAAGFGHLLTDSSTVPGLLCDVLVVRKAFLRDHPAAVRGMVAAWNEAVAFVASNPAEATEIMARDLGGWFKDFKVFEETIKTVRYYGAEDSRALFGTASQPGPLYATVKEAIDIWTSIGRVSTKVKPEDILNYTFVGS